MTFTEARTALFNGHKIRHDSMPHGNAIKIYRRGFGHDMCTIVDANENLSGDLVAFGDLFWSAILDDEGWEILSAEVPS